MPQIRKKIQFFIMGIAAVLLFLSGCAPKIATDSPGVAAESFFSLLTQNKLGQVDQLFTSLNGDPDGFFFSDAGPMDKLFKKTFPRLTYEMVGEPEIADGCAVVTVNITAVDLAQIFDSCQDEITQKIEERENSGRPLSEDEGIRLMVDTLCQKAAAADAPMAQFKVELALVNIDGDWYLLSDNFLLDAVSGGFITAVYSEE